MSDRSLHGGVSINTLHVVKDVTVNDFSFNTIISLNISNTNMRFTSGVCSASCESCHYSKINHVVIDDYVKFPQILSLHHLHRGVHHHPSLLLLLYCRYFSLPFLYCLCQLGPPIVFNLFVHITIVCPTIITY